MSISQPVDVVVQLVGTLSIVVYSFAMAFAIWKLLDIVMGVRASYAAEKEGLDSALLHTFSYPEFYLMPERDYDDDESA